MSILRTQGIYHDFNGLAVLFGIDMAVEAGQRRAVIGPNGAGKTTLFNMITGKYIPKRGSVYLDGRDVTRRSVFWRARHGLVRSFQITNIFPRLTVLESLRAAVLSRRSIRLNAFKPLSHMKEVNDETVELLGRIGLQEQGHAVGGKLAYGQQRALEIGLTLALKPRVILLDEPTAGMSGEETRHMVDLIKRITKGITLIIIEHDMDVVFDLADRITVLHYGQVLASGPKDEIQQDPRVKEAYLGEGD